VCVFVSLSQTLLSYFVGEQGRIVWDLTSGRSNGSGFGGARAALVDVSRRVEWRQGDTESKGNRTEEKGRCWGGGGAVVASSRAGEDSFFFGGLLFVPFRTGIFVSGRLAIHLAMRCRRIQRAPYRETEAETERALGRKPQGCFLGGGWSCYKSCRSWARFFMRWNFFSLGLLLR
jgi:hypothetical protein